MSQYTSNYDTTNNYYITHFEGKIVIGKVVIAMDTHMRLKQLLAERGWTEYKLSKECGLAQSTIGNVFRRNTIPSVATLETICKGFGITLSQFFAETDMVEMTPELKELFDCWVCLKPNQKEAVLNLLKSMSHDET